MKTLLTASLILMISLILNSPVVSAQGIESLVMPGDVVASHADLEAECSNCHVRFDRDAQRSLCMDCHEDVASDILLVRGYHGLFDSARTDDCSDCHTDHEGRDARIVVLDEQSFDHDLTDLPLIGGHSDVECADCHNQGDKHREAPSDCVSCHVDDDPHENFMGENCADCHTAIDWLEVEFDHDTTGYPLIGGHREPVCGDCHADQTFQNTSTACIDCHAQDDVHKGRSGEQCQDCHNPASWTDSSFDHARDTRFLLDGAHGDLACSDCHSEEPFSDELDTDCVSCHLDDDDHDGHFGPECVSCHETTAWPEVFFDHDRDTAHLLLGAHADLACAACHVEPVFSVGLTSGCNDCHATDDPHQGELGTACKDCHNELSWQNDVFFDHDLTRFPLLGQHADTECESCHESHVFRDAPDFCVDCHADEDPHDGRFTAECGACHNPVDWDAWQFDHNQQTDFPLTGAHVETGCNDCHRRSLGAMRNTGSDCSSCHRADDIHNGEFGTDCGRCHSADNFRDVRSLQ